ncbi:MAG: hypothetical protein IIC88_05920 [Chloroflexi bacterium]|nr:hypothetical protein [Chloroflexota bacterium]
MEVSEARAGVIRAPRVFVDPEAAEARLGSIGLEAPVAARPRVFVDPETAEARLGLIGLEIPGAARPRLRSAGSALLKFTSGLAALALFVLGLELLTSGASGAGSLLSRLSADGPLNLFGFGWLGAYVVLSGSPVAATSLTLFDGGVITDVESFAMINGSRFGASFIVLLVGFIYYVRHQRNPDGLYIGVVALLTTVSIYTPSALIGLLALDQGWFSGVAVGAPPALATVIDNSFGSLAEQADKVLPGLALFALGVAVLLASFQLFDKVLPNLEPPSPRLERVLSFFHRPLAMFIMGGLVTLVTLSVSISLTLLVPLSLKGVVRRHGIVPYVMGANITTFIDTLFAAVLLDAPQAVTVVVTQLVVTAAISIAVLLLVYQPYQRAILGLARRVTANRRAFIAFLATIVLVPGVLLAI